MRQAFDPVVHLTSVPLIIDGDDVDTDQIIPAQFLTTTLRKGLGDKAFYAWRYNENGTLITEHFLNRAPKGKAREILLVGDNFGCGSSREHAAWALHDYGIRVIIGHRISDIFRNNALKNGIATIDVSRTHLNHIKTQSKSPVEVDIENLSITLNDGNTLPFELDPMSKANLLAGQDELEKLLEYRSARNCYETRHQRYVEVLQ